MVLATADGANADRREKLGWSSGIMLSLHLRGADPAYRRF
jgi:hypothetical protein